MREPKRIVVKVGTAVISDPSGRLDVPTMTSIVEDVGRIVKQGKKALIVSSGAIAAGVERLGLQKRPSSIPKLQAAASIGQGLLVHRYSELFGRQGIPVGQVLVTQFDTTHRQQYLNARNTLSRLLDYGAVPIINENDTTAVDEIKFGDNDTLAAMVTLLAGADMLVLLSDIPGLHTGDPRVDERAKLLHTIEEIDEKVEALAGGVGSKFGRGGMVTKIQAAKIVTSAGIPMVIADGRQPGIVGRIVSGERVGTYFAPAKKSLAAKKLWIAYGRIPQGTVVVDDGARQALCFGGRSLLPAGVTKVEGRFDVGDAVDIADSSGRVFARGLTNFTSHELAEIKGRRTDEVAGIVPGQENEEVVHRDCLALL
ncbi:MAG: glutamate 5-kinase [Actinobacteria bacterium]|nr:MAG: glutamate 5-kinase [Actinomycetota bacterium]